MSTRVRVWVPWWALIPAAIIWLMYAIIAVFVWCAAEGTILAIRICQATTDELRERRAQRLPRLL